MARSILCSPLNAVARLTLRADRTIYRLNHWSDPWLTGGHPTESTLQELKFRISRLFVVPLSRVSKLFSRTLRKLANIVLFKRFGELVVWAERREGENAVVAITKLYGGKEYVEIPISTHEPDF